MQQVQEKVQQIILELKLQRLWKHSFPQWVTDFKQHQIGEEDFEEWLQFIYLPNLLLGEMVKAGLPQKYIVPQAVKYFGNDLKKGKLLQLLVELDSLT